MWVENDVPTLKNFYRSPFSKWPPQYRTNSTLSTNISNFGDIGQCWIFVAILKMATAGNFSMSGIYSGPKNFYRSPFSKWSPQYRTNSTWETWDFIIVRL
jgi:DUF1365 family protein